MILVGENGRLDVCRILLNLVVVKNGCHTLKHGISLPSPIEGGTEGQNMGESRGFYCGGSRLGLHCFSIKRWKHISELEQRENHLLIALEFLTSTRICWSSICILNYQIVLGLSQIMEPISGNYL